MWLDDLANKLKEINYKIDIQHKKTKESIQQLQDLYVERDNIEKDITTLEQESDDE
jgi:hypothetical protein